MSETFTASVRSHAVAELRGGCGDVDMICESFMDSNPDLVDTHRDRLVRDAIHRAITAQFRAMANDDSMQLSLPGLYLPTAIPVPLNDGTIGYVATEHATWSDLLAGERWREENLSRAQARLDDYRGSLRYLRPLMENRPKLTVAGALRRGRGAA